MIQVITLNYQKNTFLIGIMILNSKIFLNKAIISDLKLHNNIIIYYLNNIEKI